jgi:hypothetical protein
MVTTRVSSNASATLNWAFRTTSPDLAIVGIASLFRFIPGMCTLGRYLVHVWPLLMCTLSRIPNFPNFPNFPDVKARHTINTGR